MVQIRKWVNEKLISPARSLAPRQVGLAVAVGFYGGIFPIPACSTFATLALCSAILKSSFNPAMTTIAISINLAATPVQLMFMPVFLDLPSRFAGLPSCNVSDLVTSMKTKPVLETVSSFGSGMIWATLAWGILAPVSILALRFLIAYILAGRKAKL